MVVKPSDKSKGFVVMSRGNSVQKASEISECPENYEKCDIAISDLDRQKHTTVDDITVDKLPPAFNKSILPRISRKSQFHGSFDRRIHMRLVDK